MARATKAEQAEARQLLLDNFGLRKGTRIWTIPFRVADASSVIGCYVIDEGRILQLPPRRIAQLTGFAVAEGGGEHIGNRVRAYGTSRAFEVVEGLGHAIHGDGGAFVFDRL